MSNLTLVTDYCPENLNFHSSKYTSHKKTEKSFVNSPAIFFLTSIHDYLATQRTLALHQSSRDSRFQNLPFFLMYKCFWCRSNHIQIAQETMGLLGKQQSPDAFERVENLLFHQICCFVQLSPWPGT